MAHTGVPILELRDISKEYFGNKVLTDVSFSLHSGEILGLVGENGAGKSTLMNILFGMEVIQQTGGYAGEMLVAGQTVRYQSSFDAIADGIGMVHQEFSLLPDFSVAENILLNREPHTRSFVSEVFGDRLDSIDRKTLVSKAETAIGKLGVSIDSSTPVGTMPVGHKQFTEIARELSKDSIRILVLDEPTAVLTEQEAAILLKAVKKLSDEGIAIIFISHRLQEVVDVCDTVVVLRDGKVVHNEPAAGLTIEQIARWMVGRDVDQSRTHRAFDYAQAPPVLTIENLWVDMPGETVRDVSLAVHKGEILGIGGLAGQGKLGIPNGAMGLFPAGGKVVFEGEEIALNNPKNFLDAGMAFVSEDRRGVGLLLDESLDWNISFAAMQVRGKYLKRYLNGMLQWRDEKSIQETARHYIDALQIKCTSSKQKAKELSGGNQQKICCAKAFALEPRLLFVSEPTRGIDIGAKSLVLQALRDYNEKSGTTIVMISSELEELRAICDRIAIVTDGRIAGILPANHPSEDFGLLMVASPKGATEVTA
ncbi:MAG: sugar ABC transporter ATP-binding protein [Sphaerochaetaceae bacterium]|jgi:simple sugar transport system ATP-binding protein|nr:sugar ABC transporter ATP-binding protein [Sphaerochaetaceae bacterium]MDX9939724.1 sugar ABC transporter ATP-binding protein [Sphaerochaetaceae bacterium]